MLTIQNLSKSFSEQILFKQASFSLNSKEKVALIGLNGHGKSTLINLLIGREKPDEGLIKYPKDYKLGFLPQNITCTQKTVLEEALSGLPEAVLNDLWKLKRILTGLGLPEETWDKSPMEFSHGYQMRIALSKVLVVEPQLLLLDEPTNFLDIVSLRWLKSFLYKWPNELILVSHDKGFLDNLISHVLGIHRSNKGKAERRDLYSTVSC